MKKRKILFLLPLAGMILSGCDFDPQSLLNSAGGFFTQTIPNEFNKFLDGMLGRKSEEPQKEEKEEKPSEQEGEGEGEQQKQKELVSISLSGQFKTEYEVGEEFDPAGIMVTAVYDDDSSEDVTNSVTFSGFDSSQPGECTVTVSFGGQSAEFQLTVVSPIRSLSFPEALAFFEAEGIEGVAIPNYVTPEGTLSVDSASGAYLISSSTHDEMDDYAEALDDAGWTLQKDSYGDYSGVFGDTRAQVYLGDYLEYSYKAIVLQFSAAKAPSPQIPFDEIEAMFEEEQYVYYGHIPSFESANAEFVADLYSSTGWSYDGVLVNIKKATDEEIENYLTVALPGAGWSVGGGIATQAFPDLGGVATLAYATLTDGSFGLLLYFGFTPIPAAGFPSEDLAAAFQALGVTPYEIPEPDGEGYTYEYAFDEANLNYVTSPSLCYDVMYINNMNEDQFSAYVAKIKAAGWTDTESNGTHTFTKEFGEKMAKFTAAHYYSDAYGHYVGMRIFYVMTDIPKWPEDKAAQLVEKFAPGSSTVIPACPGGTNYSAYIGNTYNEIDVSGPESLKDDYADILRQAGWTETAADSYVFVSPAEDIQITLAFTSYGLEIRVAAYVKPAAVWPADEIAALLPTGLQDAVPEYTGDNDGFQVLNDSYGSAVVVTVAEGTESDAIAAYKEMLETAGFTYNAGFDFYVSPNNEIVIPSPYMGTSGSFTIEFKESLLVFDFPLATLNAFLETYELGFQLSGALGSDANGSGYWFYEDCGTSSYAGTRILFAGNQVDAIYAQLAAVIPASYEWDDDYECWFDDTTYHEVDLYYASGSTYLSFWE